MNRIVGKSMKVLLFVLLLAGITTAVPASNITYPCSLSSVKGHYGMQGQGTVVQYQAPPAPPFPFAEVATEYFDGVGNWSSDFLANADGMILGGPVTGKYTVNANCTGTVLFAGVRQFFVVLGNGSLRKIDTDSWELAVRTSDPKAKAGSCSLNTLKGNYSVQGLGTVVAQVPGWPAPPFAMAEEARYSLDGAGNLSGKFTANVDGTLVKQTLQGTYTVKPNCTGTIASNGGGLPFNQWFVVLLDGRLRLIQTDSWITITRTMERMPD